MKSIPARVDKPMLSERTVASGDETSGTTRVRQKRLIYRHSASIRLTHWLNLIFMTIMLMSGLQIFNARPDLYLGAYSAFKHPLVAFEAKQEHGKLVGITKIFGHQFDTTGFLAVSPGIDGRPMYRAFPAWATIPSSAHWLAMGRRWHFFFAWLFVLNGLAFTLYAIFSGHLRRDLLPSRDGLKHIGRSIWHHITFRYPENEAGRYNVLQKLSYLIVLFGLGPLIVATGLTMSPQIDTAFPWLLTLFGGRQTARTIHFCTAFSFLGFFVIHIVMVLISGVFNNLRAMVTGRFSVKSKGNLHEQ
jgi:thiosulfate reductase cytochrome b subunit